jgi:hypothetical protein
MRSAPSQDQRWKRKVKCSSPNPHRGPLRDRLSRGSRRFEGLYAGDVAAHWVRREAIVATRACFHARLSCARRSAVSWKSVPFQVILPFGYVLLRAPSLPSPLEDLSVRALPARGLGPLHDVTRRRPLSRGFPSPRSVPSSGALSLPTVCSATELAGLFHPAAMFRTHPVQGLSLSAQPLRFVTGLSCPLAVAAASLTSRPVPMTQRLGFEALLRAESRGHSASYSLDERSLPSSGSLLLQVAPSPRHPRSLTELGPLMTFRRLQRIHDEEPDTLFRQRRPARAFGPASSLLLRESIRRGPLRIFSTGARSNRQTRVSK